MHNACCGSLPSAQDTFALPALWEQALFPVQLGLWASDNGFPDKTDSYLGNQHTTLSTSSNSPCPPTSSEEM